MTFKTIISFMVTLACALLITTSCSTLEVHHTPSGKIGHGPPAHARAHGYRRKHVAGMELVYDSGRGVYIVVGLSNHYYHDGYFYRLSGTLWEVSSQPNGGWASVSEKSLPPGLQAKGIGKGKGKNKRAS
ncbi:MAG: hypothetical protein ACYTFW_01855 [Planctomycetota bacterium]|jgi:hypothetical protein